MGSGRKSQLLFAILTTCLFSVACAHKLAPVRPALEMPDSSDNRYSDATGQTVLAELAELRRNAIHYENQAQRYDEALLVLRLTALGSSFLAACVLALTEAKWGRKAALVLSIVATSVPVIDQVFAVNEMRQGSWRSVHLLVTGFDSLRSAWEVSVHSRMQTPNDARELVEEAKNQLNKAVEEEMEISLKPTSLQLRLSSQ